MFSFKVIEDTVSNVLFAIMAIAGVAAMILGIGALLDVSWATALVALAVGLPAGVYTLYRWILS